MADVLRLANAVAGRLAAYNAEVLFFPTFDLRELEEMRVIVVPVSVEYKNLSRSSHEELQKVQVGILKRGCEDDLSEMLRFVERLGLGFLNTHLAEAVCVCVAYNPIYYPEHLRERGQFTSVIELTFKRIQ